MMYKRGQVTSCFDADGQFARIWACRDIMSVKVLVSRVKIWGAEDQNTHLADPPVSDTRWNQHGHLWPDVVLLPIQLNRGSWGAFQNDVHLGVFPVIVDLGVSIDVGQVYRSGELFAVRKCSSSDPTRANHRRQLRQVEDLRSDCWLICHFSIAIVVACDAQGGMAA